MFSLTEDNALKRLRFVSEPYHSYGYVVDTDDIKGRNKVLLPTFQSFKEDVLL